ncbi:MAG: hypothetical protein CMK07_11905 [Ponticaulis sp.]|nr:hypothetical protein [Ponticaulis sp.]
MPLYVPDDTIGTGVQFEPLNGDIFIIREGIEIISTTGNAFASGSADSVALNIAGWVHGYGSAILLNASSQYADFDVSIGTTGQVSSSAGNGMRIWGNYDSPGGTASIQNAGIIQTEGLSVNLQRFDTIAIDNAGLIVSSSTVSTQSYAIFAVGHDIRIVNSGTISRASAATDPFLGGATITAVNWSGRVAGDYLSVTNTGFIFSPNQAIGSQNGVDHIINDGLIEGKILLGWDETGAGYDDVLINRGDIYGDIDLGAGQDELLGQTGFIEGTIDAGAGDDLIKSGTGDDMIIGGAGADEMWGGAGVDTASYEGSADGVRVSLNAGRGWYGDAQGDALHEIENLIGSDRKDTLIGSSLANQLEGGNADDVLNGLSGDDTIFGGNGADNILGGSGNDYISGDRHQDKLTGGTGEDIFAFLNILDSGPAQSERDNITDFTQGQDLIDLTELGDLFFGGTAFSGAAGEIIYYHVAGGTRTVVEIDTDGDSVADFGILLSNAAHTMTAADFLFV